MSPIHKLLVAYIKERPYFFLIEDVKVLLRVRWWAS